VRLRETTPAETTCAARVVDAKTSTDSRIPVACLTVSFNVPSSGVATVKVRVFFVRLKAAV
jgi:hypothetical protein